MNFDLSDKQIAWQKTCWEFCKSEVLPVRELLETDIDVRRDLYNKMARQGFFSMNIGDHSDGLSYVLAIIAFANADAGVAVAMAVSNWVAEAIYRYGTEDQKQRYLPRISVSGDWVGACFALTEENAGSDAKSIECRADPVQDSYVINGHKKWITNGNLADICLVFAKVPSDSGHGITGFLVEKGTPGWNVNRIVDKLGLLTVNLTCMEFNNCHVNQDQVLGTVGSGLKMALAMLDRGRLGIAAQAIGIAEAAFEASVQHAKTREQFGKPIGENEAIAFKLADMKVKLEASKLLLFKAVRLRDQKKPFSEEAAMAKLYASEAANEIAAEAVQIHGGYGYIKDYPIERYYRDARITTIYEGTSEIQRLVISRHILK